uniref:Neur_chan_LBD domain-containing protein n=1 Tax=Macrostomum lignano TaxID=282301 RepID=A0A1I8JJA1_9PLAT
SSEFCILWVRLENGSFGIYDTAVLRVQFKRLPTFYIINLMLPSILLLGISTLAFCLPPECGERVSFSITIVLSMCVFLQLVGNYTPTQSESVPLITWYFSLAVVMTIMNVLCNAFVLSCHFRQESSVSSRVIRALFLNRFALRRSCPRKVASAATDADSTQSDVPSDVPSENEWKTVGSSADRVFFKAFATVVAVILIVPFAISFASWNMSCLGMSDLLYCMAFVFAFGDARADAAVASPDAALVVALKLATEYNSWVRPPPDAGNANTVNVPVAQLFRIELKDLSLNEAPVGVISNGIVHQGLELLVTFKCKMQMYLFPFDKQKCRLRIYSRLQTKETMTLNTSRLFPNISMETYLMKNNEFCITNLQLEQEEAFGQNAILFTISFQRGSAFYFTTLILPSVLLLGISTLAFCLPPECGERVSFSITIVLSMCVFLQLAGNYMPTQSESVPLMTWYFSSTVLLTMVNVLCNAFVVSCHFEQQSRSRVSNRLIRALFLNRFAVWISSSRKRAVANVQSSQAGDCSSAGEQGDEWAAVVRFADAFFFMLFLLATLASIFPMAILMAVSSQTEWQSVKISRNTSVGHKRKLEQVASGAAALLIEEHRLAALRAEEGTHAHVRSLELTEIGEAMHRVAAVAVADLGGVAAEELIREWLVLAAASAATVAAGAAAIANVSPDESVMAALKFPTEYNRAARPPPDNGNANTVNVFVFFNGITRLHWTDTRLSWYNKFNATLDSIDFIIVPASLLWQPDVSFLEAIELKDVGNSRDFVMLHNDGTLLRSGGMVLTSKCKMEMYRFPFDLQTCALRIATIFDTTGSTSLGILPLNISHELYLNKSNEFCILGLDYEISKLVEKNVPEFRITFQRMSTFYVVNLMLPSILLLAISALAFRMPPECGERVSFSITIVLSMCVFLQLAGNYTPTQSESIPLITWYFSVTLLMTILNVLCNAFVLSCHFKKQCSLKVSNRFIRVLFFNRIMMKSTAGAKISPSDSVGPQPQQNQEDTTVKFENDWADVGALADKTFFAVFLVATAVLTLSLVIFQLSVYRTDCLGLL